MMATLMWLLLNELSQKLIKAHFDILVYCIFTGTVVLSREDVTEYTLTSLGWHHFLSQKTQLLQQALFSLFLFCF